MMNDLPVRLNPERGRIRFRNADPFVYVYFLAEHPYSAEGQGFWMAPGPSDVVFRVDGKIRQINLTVHSDVANQFDATVDGTHQRVTLAPGEQKKLTFDVSNPVHADGADVYQLSLFAANGVRPSDLNKTSGDTRLLGVFVDVEFVSR